jgi:ArsR family transcriptional regulator, arsenate/arsenite/antimonite-responsive transcriptional repressor
MKKSPSGEIAVGGISVCETGCESGPAYANIVALQLKALGHPVRLQIVDILRARDQKCCGDICSCLPLAQSTISQHLELLCRSGLVNCKPAGTRTHYSLNTASIANLAARLAGLSMFEGDSGNSESDK